MTIITITRAKQYKTAVRNSRHDWKWTYSWVADDDSHMQKLSDGRTVNVGSYGSDLGSLIDMLRRKFPQATITRSWDQSSWMVN